MRKKYTTTLEETLTKTLKVTAAKEEKDANDIIEELLRDYFKKKGITIE